MWINKHRRRWKGLGTHVKVKFGEVEVQPIISIVSKVYFGKTVRILRKTWDLTFQEQSWLERGLSCDQWSLFKFSGTLQRRV